MGSSELTPSQRSALDVFDEFLGSSAHVLLVTGAAGTGKTFILREFANRLAEQYIPAAFVAPTGRAARVLSGSVGEASTIHSFIYRFDGLEEEHAEDGHLNGTDVRFRFALHESAHVDTRVFIADESSMIGDRASQDEHLTFGSGRLLKDLLEYVFVEKPPRARRQLVFVGDPYQLPPVDGTRSPALDSAYLADEYGLDVRSVTLTDIVRQRADSGVLELAADVRDALDTGTFTRLKLRREVPGVTLLDASGLHDTLMREFEGGERDSSLMVVRSNERALHINQVVRERLHGDAEIQPQPGDRVIVVENSHLYYLFNGEFGTVVSAAPTTERRLVSPKGGTEVELIFRDAQIEFASASGSIVKKVKLFEPLLHSPERTLLRQELAALYADFGARHKGVKRLSVEWKELLRTDLYFNAIRLKYGWAVTCHKAQGGEWDTVFIEFDHPARSEDSFRWIYTALTRSRSRLFLVNAPDFGPGTGAALALTDQLTSEAALQSRIVEASEMLGLKLDSVRPRQWCLRCTFDQPEGAAEVDIHYRRDGAVTSVREVRPGQVGAELLRNLERVLARPTAEQVERPAAVVAFETALSRRLEVDGGTLEIVRSVAYQVRYLAVHLDGKATFSIYYNKDGRLSDSVQFAPGAGPSVLNVVRDVLEAL